MPKTNDQTHISLMAVFDESPTVSYACVRDVESWLAILEEDRKVGDLSNPPGSIRGLSNDSLETRTTTGHVQTTSNNNRSPGLLSDDTKTKRCAAPNSFVSADLNQQSVHKVEEVTKNCEHYQPVFFDIYTRCTSDPAGFPTDSKLMTLRLIIEELIDSSKAISRMSIEFTAYSQDSDFSK